MRTNGGVGGTSVYADAGHVISAGRPSRTREVEVGPFWINDSARSELVAAVVDRSLQSRTRPLLAFALHVGGLNARRERDFVVAMRAADIVYADGGSVVLLAKLAGAERVERAPTTDIGWEVLRDFAGKLGRIPRVALIGGPPGLAGRAGAVLEESGYAEVVAVEHGYHRDWTVPLTRVRDARPDVTLVGLGAPREMVWSQDHRDELPPGLLLTCGGWFGHIVGDERRAPVLLRRSGLEWISRVAQSPGRLGPRYARGVGVTAALAIATLQRRSPDAGA